MQTMKRIPSGRTAFNGILFAAILIGGGSMGMARQWVAVSYYRLIERVPDILIVRVARIEGEPYAQKAVAVVERSFKQVYTKDTIDLPFVYTSWPAENGVMESVSETMPVSFDTGGEYLVLITKWHRRLFGPRNAAVTEYEVLNYPKGTLIRLTGRNETGAIGEILRLLAITNQENAEARVDSLISLLHNDDRGARLDAVEALTDLRTDRAADPFIRVLRSDPDVEVRSAAALGLGYLRVDSVVDVLMEQVRVEQNRTVKWRIVNSLGMLDAKKATPMLLAMYPTADYDIRSAILTAVTRAADTSAAPELLKLYFSETKSPHRYQMVEALSQVHTALADSFTSAILDTCADYGFKAAVVGGWTFSNYTQGLAQIVRWVEKLCAPEAAHPLSRPEFRLFSELSFTAIEKLGTPEQTLNTLKRLNSCSQGVYGENVSRILKDLLKKDLAPPLRQEAEDLLKSIPPSGH